jgi:hypothetical protein
MSVRLRSLLVLLPIAALLALPAAALAAKTKTRVEPAQTTGVLNVRASNGWTIQISAIAFGSRPDHHPVGVFASGPHHEEVDYQEFAGHFTADGTIEAKLPGIGHIDLRYEPTTHHTTHIVHPKNCTGAHSSIDSSGVFRGTIVLRGEGGFTTVMAHSAKGELSTYPKQTCRVRADTKAEVEREIARQEKAEAGEGPQIESLYAYRKLGAGSLTFDATSFPTFFKGLPPRYVEFTAAYSRRHDGMWVTAQARVEGKPEDFAVSAPTGTASEATVGPPAPFEGSAEFSLESPTVASWTGDLRVAIPTLGTVDLTGPKFKSTLCEGNTCTETSAGTHISVFAGGTFGE